MYCAYEGGKVTTVSGRAGYLPITDRPTIKWPDGARVAVWIVPNVEHKDFLPPPSRTRDAWPRTPHPDVAQYGQYDYGNRVAFWRMLEVFDQYRVRATASLNQAVLDHFPEVKEAMLTRDWGFMSHGLYNSRFYNELAVDEERDVIRYLIDQFRRHTGRDLKGILTPAISMSEHTPDLLAEAGFIYHADWLHDDQPFPLRVRTGKLISMPYGIDVEDGNAFFWNYPPAYWAQCVKDQFDVLYAEGARSGQALCVSLHPMICAHPSRIDFLDEILRYVLTPHGVWQATADEIAEYYIANYYDDVVARVNRRESERRAVLRPTSN